MAQDSAGNSGSAMLTMQEGGGGYYPQPVYPGVAPARKLNRQKKLNFFFSLELISSEWWWWWIFTYYCTRYG